MRVLEQNVDPDGVILEALRAGSAADEAAVEETVRAIIADVRARGDEALLELGRRFDCASLAGIRVPDDALSAALDSLEPGVARALERAAGNIREFHEREKSESWVSARGGTVLGQLVTPLDSVGIYVPGGRASYPSTVLMTAIPAAVAGVERIAVASPASDTGLPPAAVLAACRMCGVTDVYAAGGAQAIAAFAYGTESVRRVDKVVGPGNQYVNVAKRVLFGQVGIDSLAGPSEVLILADESARPAWVAADLAAQAEHGGESKAVLVTWSRRLVDQTLRCVQELCEKEPRGAVIREALNSRGCVLLVPGLDDAVRWTNLCAPEHLQVLLREPARVLGRLRNAGAVFVGDYSPVPLGDYSAGPSHTLPTGAAARFSSALGVAEFQKRSSLIWYGPREYADDALAAMTVAEAEGLHAHRTSLALRLEALDEETGA